MYEKRSTKILNTDLKFNRLETRNRPNQSAKETKNSRIKRRNKNKLKFLARIAYYSGAIAATAAARIFLLLPEVHS